MRPVEGSRPVEDICACFARDWRAGDSGRADGVRLEAWLRARRAELLRRELALSIRFGLRTGAALLRAAGRVAEVRLRSRAVLVPVADG